MYLWEIRISKIPRINNSCESIAADQAISESFNEHTYLNR